MAISFDLRAPTFCQDADNNHEADRVETLEDFTTDIQNLYLLLRALGLKALSR